jgi:hypothetical protein
LRTEFVRVKDTPGVPALSCAAFRIPVRIPES